MKIRHKILIGFGVPTAVALVIGAVVFVALTRSLDTTARVTHTQQVIAQGNQLIKAVVDAETGMRGFVITREERFLEPFTHGNATIENTSRTLKALVADNPPQVARLDQLLQLHQQWLTDVATPVIVGVRANGFNRSGQVVKQSAGKRLVDAQRAVIDGFLQTEQRLLQVRTASSDSAARTSRVVLIGGFGLFILLAIGIGLALARRLSDSAQAVTRAAGRLAEGDTTVRADVRSTDEIGELAGVFNGMADRLVAAAQTERESREALQVAVGEYSEFAAKVAGGDLTAVVSTNGSSDLQVLSENLNSMSAGLADISGQVRSGVQDIRASTTEILAAVSQHTASASQQSAAISQTSTTVDEVRVASEQTSMSARAVAEQAERSVQVSDEGTRAVETIGTAMEEIRDRVEAIARDILVLSEQTQQIGEITATVNDLADQSNILALNASIEAAKAGEHGKGFAVVATEVRNLAEQSKGATAQVRRILSDIQNATSAAVLATEQGTKVVEGGLELSGRAGGHIRSLAATIREASHSAQQIAASAHEQSVGMDQIAHAMNDINASTSQFVAGAEQSQQAAKDLTGLADKLALLTERYRV